MKKAMVYGAGVSGLAACELLKKNGYEVILVDDNKGLSSNEALNYLDGVEVFIKSPGIPYNALILEVINRGIELIDEIELAYRYSKGKFKIVAVTGTNGKTTTTSKIDGLFKKAGFKSEAGGNIGKPFAQIVLENKDLDFVVLELSSYQLENLKEFKADLSLVINLSPDHMDRYEKVEDYYLAKFNIKNNATESDYFILNIDSKEVMDLYEKKLEKEPLLNHSVNAYRKIKISEDSLLIVFPDIQIIKDEIEKLRIELSMLVLERDELKFIICENI